MTPYRISFAAFSRTALLAACLVAPAMTACAATPQRPAATAAPAPAPGGMVVPMSRAGSLEIVQVRINGSEPKNFVFDTGMEVTLIDASLAAALNLPVEAAEETQVAGGKIKIGMAQGVVLAMGPVTSKPLTIMSAPLGGLASVIGQPVDGIIGHDFIEQFSVHVDAQQDQLVFWSPDKFAAPKGYTSVPVQILNAEVFLPVGLVTLDGRKVTGSFKIDTASTDAMGMNKNFVEDNKIVAPGQVKLPMPGVALGGETQGAILRLGAINLAGAVFENPLVSYTIDAKGTENRPNGGTIGQGLLTAFDVYLDYPNSRIFLKQAEGGLREDRFGARYQFSGDDYKTVTVSAVTVTSAAAVAGLEPEDQILSVNDATPTFNALWDISDSSAPVTLQVMRKGQKLPVTVKPDALISD